MNLDLSLVIKIILGWLVGTTLLTLAWSRWMRYQREQDEKDSEYQKLLGREF